MINTIYAEFRKLLSVRSTYIISLLSIVLSGALAFWGTGYKGAPHFATTVLQGSALTTVSIVDIFVGIVAILLICHEYRYNTISYTLTASNSRLKVLLSKLIVTGVYAIVMTIIAVVAGMGLTMLGAKVAGSSVGAQDVNFYDILWRSLAFMVGGAWMGLVLGFLFRSLVFSIVAYFLLPTMIEPLLHNLLKVSNNVLPDASQTQMLMNEQGSGLYTALGAAGVFALYLVGLWLVATVLFVRRDSSSSQ